MYGLRGHYGTLTSGTPHTGSPCDTVLSVVLHQNPKSPFCTAAAHFIHAPPEILPSHFPADAAAASHFTATHTFFPGTGALRQPTADPPPALDSASVALWRFAMTAIPESGISTPVLHAFRRGIQQQNQTSSRPIRKQEMPPAHTCFSDHVKSGMCLAAGTWRPASGWIALPFLSLFRFAVHPDGGCPSCTANGFYAQLPP